MVQKFRSILFYSLLIFIGGSISSWVVVNVLLKPSPQTEAPELVYAKTQAQLAELARNQESNIFWGHFFQWVAILMLLALVAGVGTTIAIVWRKFIHQVYIEEVQIRMDATFVKPDVNGNYPVFRRKNGEFFLPEPGNPGVPGPAQQVMMLSETAKRPGARRLKLNGTSGPFSIKWDEEETPTPNSPNTHSEANRTNERTNDEPSVLTELREAWERGESKTTAIPRITGAKRGDNKAWKTYSQEWDKF